MTDPKPRGWVRRLTDYVMRQRTDVLIAVGAAILGSASQVAVPLIARTILDDVIVAKSAPLLPWVGLLFAVALAGFGFTYLRRYRGGRVALRVQYDLRNDMHANLQTMDQASLSRLPTGQLVSRANSDTSIVQGLLSMLPMMSGNILLMVLSLVVMIVLSPPLAIISVLTAPLLLLVSYRMRSKIFPASWDAQQREGEVAQIVDEDVSGVRIVKAFGQEKRETHRLIDVAKNLYGSQMRTVRLQARYQPLMQTIPVLAQVAVLGFGGWMALHGHITLGTFLAFSTYIAKFTAPARQLAGIMTIAQQARASVERIVEVLDMRPQIADAPGAEPLTDVRGELEFRDVDFRYGEGEPVLSGFNLRIRAGERVAIVGPSGSGKTTAAMLAGRFHDPTSGAVTIDGRDLRRTTLNSLRDQLGFAFEESFLFSDSVRANIAYGRPGAGDDEVRAAARAARADGFIDELPRGYDTPIGERGLTLSGGQRQRIALARAILKNPRILILDDATSAVDARVEEGIHDALREVTAGRTTLFIAHRQSTIHLADRIVVLAGGQVAATGTHDDLMERSTIYRALISGLGDDESADDIDSLSARAVGDGWSNPTADDPRRRAAATGGARASAGGRGGGGGRWQMNLAPSPALLAQVDALPPIRDTAEVDDEAETRPDPQFSLLRLLKGFRTPLFIGLALVVLDALAGLAGPVLIKTGIDDGVSKGVISVLVAASAVFLAISLFDLAVSIGETFVTGRTAQRIMLSLRARIWAQLQRLSLDYYEREMGGRIMTRMTSDVDQFESLIQNGLLSALVSVVTFVGVGVALLTIDLELGLYTLIVVAVLVVATYYFRRAASRLYSQARERIAVVNADFQESLSGVRESQAYVHEAATVDRFRYLGKRYLDSRVAAQRLVATFFPFVQFLAATADAIALGVGATLIEHGSLTSGALIAFLLYLNMFFAPIQQLSQVFDSWQQTRVSVGRISELMALTTLTPQAENPVVPGRLTGTMRADDLRFAYPRLTPDTTPEALRGIDLDIPAGGSIALVGETGAGKSTVMKLLARFYDPDSGSVTVDGHDLRTLDLTAFRSNLGYVPQESFLFTGSVRDNIAYGRPDATDREVEDAARAVGAHDFVIRLPHGYLQPIAERGGSLSSGERQLIALARARLVDPAVLFLDEATSNLDLVTESRVNAAMDTLSAGRTTVLIAHRLQTARTADRIAVIDAGEIAEIGSHDELLRRGGAYASMWALLASDTKADSRP